MHLRLGYYAAVPPAAAADGAMRYGAHTDYTGFTILRQDPTVHGLEAQTRDGSWHPVPPKAGEAAGLREGGSRGGWGS